MKETDHYFEIESNDRIMRVQKNRDPLWTEGGVQIQVYESVYEDDSSEYINLTDEALQNLIGALQAVQSTK